jgi:UDP-glucuronate 4-epimerase
VLRAVVTGAAGFVGSHLSEALIARGDAVLGVDCFTPYYDEAQKRRNLDRLRAEPAFRFEAADLRSADIVALLDGVDVVFHLAAQPGVRLSWAEGFATYNDHNVLATQRLLEAARMQPAPPRVVYASSSSVYGNQPRYPTRETDLPRPYSPYGVTKLAAEHLCALYASNYRLKTVSLRYFTVFGPRQRPDMSIHRLCEAAISATTFPRYGDGSQIREFTYVADIVAANLCAADADVEPGVVANVAGGGEISLNELIALVGEIADAPVTIDQQPAQPGDSVRNGGAIDKARELFGWEPRTTLREGLVAQLAWHRSRAEGAARDDDGVAAQ